MSDKIDMDEQFFSDPSIVDQDTAMIGSKGEPNTNGVCLIIEIHGRQREVLLEYDELKAALSYLQEDRDAMPHLYAKRGSE